MDPLPTKHLKRHNRYQPIIEQKDAGNSNLGGPRIFGLAVSKSEDKKFEVDSDDSMDSTIFNDFDSTDEVVHELMSELLKAVVGGAKHEYSSEKASQETIPVAPITAFRRGIVSVSDISRQMWCEQQLSYSFIYPYIEDEEGNIVRVHDCEDDQAHMRVGTDLHEQRELEVHEIVELRCQNRTQSYAVRLFNMIIGFDRLYELIQTHKAGVVREVPIFGRPFEGVNLYFRGIIDEIGYDPKVGNGLSVVEFKTRSRPGLPSNSQMLTHKIQVNIYRQLLNRLILAKDIQSLQAEYFLKFELEPMEDLVDDNCDPQLRTLLIRYKCSNLSDLFDLVLTKIKRLPVVRYGWIEYMYQTDEKKELNKSSFIEFDAKNLRLMLVEYENYWLGQRECNGVEIEEIWKCNRCAYIDICEWRRKKSREKTAESRKRKAKHTL